MAQKGPESIDLPPWFQSESQNLPTSTQNPIDQCGDADIGPLGICEDFNPSSSFPGNCQSTLRNPPLHSPISILGKEKKKFRRGGHI